MRSLQRNFQCPSCKAQLDKVICSKSKDCDFNDFTLWGDSIGPDFTYDERGQMFFPNDYYKLHVSSLWMCKCQICHQVRRDLKGLRTHVKQEHTQEICQLCIDNRHHFPSEHKYHTQSGYEVHLRKGDGDGMEGHPICEFCRKRYFDRTSLFTHLMKDHFSCHICEKAGVKHKYYASYDTLETHFRQSHHLCEERSCLVSISCVLIIVSTIS